MTTPAGFRREPGDWPCSQCGEVNFKSRDACRRCATPRQRTASSATAAAPQMQQKPGDWPCSQCGEVNFKSRDACRRCATPRQPTASSATAAAPQMQQKPSDWTCNTCKNINFATRIACHKCGRGKPQQQEQPLPVRTPAMVVPPKPGDWKCSSCPEMNFGSRVQCRSCGTARPTDEKKADSECVICMEKPIDSVFTSCGHSAVCLECGGHIAQCPVCRTPILQGQLIKLFNVH